MFLLANLLLLISCAIILLIIYFKNAYTFWSNKKVPTLPTLIPFGNFKSFLLHQKSIGEQMLDLYNKVKYSGKPFYGLYMLWKPSLMILDPNLARDILVKDFPNFLSRQRQGNPNNPLSNHLVNISGKEWKFLRTKLTPTFSSGKMKFMFQTISQCGDELNNIINNYAESGEPLEVKDILARFTTDIIASCAFGVDCNSLKEPNNEFRKHGIRIFHLSEWEHFKNLILRFFPFLAKVLHLNRLTKETVEFFKNLVTTTVEFREKNNYKRKDFLDLLLQLRSQGFVEDDDDDASTSLDLDESSKLTMEQIAAQCFLFFIAGFETSSSTLSSAMYELAVNQDVQDKTREEIRKVLKKYKGEITYDAVMEMDYLEQVLDETMRLHPSIPLLSRKCTADYKFGNSDLEIKKGIVVFIPIKGFHTDSKYYPNPQLFDPDRFSSEEKAKRHPYVFSPFGGGPRQCIGLRFAKLQMKVGLSILLRNHKFTLNSKTQTPLQINPRSSFHSIKGGIWINVEEIKKCNF